MTSVTSFDEYLSGGDPTRNSNQDTAVESLLKLRRLNPHLVPILAAAAGFGKTKTSQKWVFALEKLHGERLKSLYVTTRRQIADSLFSELCNLSDRSVMIYYGGRVATVVNGDLTEWDDDDVSERKHIDLVGEYDIVITTVDQMCALQNSHVDCVTYIHLLQDRVMILDEYHEIVSIPKMILFLKEMFDTKRELVNDHILPMSATPNLPLSNALFGTEKFHLVRTKSVYDKQVRVVLHLREEIGVAEAKEFFSGFSDRADVLSVSDGLNPLRDLAFEGEGGFVYSSYLDTPDRRAAFSSLMDHNGKHASLDSRSCWSGPVLQASVDASWRCLATTTTTPENLLQRGGRTQRHQGGVAEWNILLPTGESKVHRHLWEGLRPHASYVLGWSRHLVSIGERLGAVVENSVMEFTVAEDFLYNEYFDYSDKCLKDTKVKDELSEYIDLGIKDLKKEDFFEPRMSFAPKKKRVQDKLASRSMRGNGSVWISVSECDRNKVETGAQRVVSIELKPHRKKLIAELELCGAFRKAHGFNKYNCGSPKKMFYLARNKNTPIILPKEVAKYWFGPEVSGVGLFWCK